MKFKKLCTLTLISTMIFANVPTYAKTESPVADVTISSNYVETGEPVFLTIETTTPLGEGEFLSVGLINLSSSQLLYNYMTLYNDGINNYGLISTKYLDEGRYQVTKLDVVDKDGNILRTLKTDQGDFINDQFDLVDDVYEIETIDNFSIITGKLDEGEKLEMNVYFSEVPTKDYRIVVSFKNVRDKNETFDVILEKSSDSKIYKTVDDSKIPNVTGSVYEVYEINQYEIVEQDGKEFEVLEMTYDGTEFPLSQVTVYDVEQNEEVVENEVIDEVVVPKILIDGVDSYAISDIDTAQNLEIKTTLSNNVSTVEIPYSFFTQIKEENSDFNFEIKAENFTYYMPINIEEKTLDIEKILSGNLDSELNEVGVKLKISITDVSENSEYKKSFENYFDNAVLTSGIYDVKLELLEDEKVLGEIENFSEPIKKELMFVRNQSEFNSIFILNENNELEFIPHTINGNVGEINNLKNGTFGVITNNVSFVDVKKDSWYEESVLTSASKGLVSGVGNDMFNPTGNVTRAEFVTMIINGLDLSKNTSVTSEYSDVSKNKWYYENIMLAKSYGLLEELGTDKFNPDAYITREEMASIIGKVISQQNVMMTMEYIELDTVFVEVKDIEDIYLDDVELAYKTKIMRGNNKNEFNPNGNSTRAEATIVQMNLLELLGKL